MSASNVSSHGSRALSTDGFTGSSGFRKRAFTCTGPGVGPRDDSTACAAIRTTARIAAGDASGSPSSAKWRTYPPNIFV